MQSVIHRIFLGESDEEVHNEFVKYSKGIFENKYLLKGKKQKSGWQIKTSAEFVNFLVRSCLERMRGEIDVKGVIVSTFDMRSILGEHVFSPDEKVKQFMGIKQIIVDAKIPPEKVIEVMDKFPRAFYALSFSTSEFQLKVKAKAPKSAKPASGGEKEAVPDFCSLKTSDREIVEDLFFDFPDFKEIKISHSIHINEIEIPKGISDTLKIREMSVRKGMIVRKIVIDGDNREKQTEFKA